jgi:hypothetical protein
MPGPAGFGEHVTGDLLEQGGYEGALHALRPAETGESRPAGDHRGHAPSGGDPLCERAQVDDVSVSVVEHERHERRRRKIEVPGGVVLDQESAR